MPEEGPDQNPYSYPQYPNQASIQPIATTVNAYDYLVGANQTSSKVKLPPLNMGVAVDSSSMVPDQPNKMLLQSDYYSTNTGQNKIQMLEQ